MKRGRLVRLDCRAHDPEVAGSNLAPASTYHGNPKHVSGNIIFFSEHLKSLLRKTSFSASFTKIANLLRHRNRPNHERQITYVKRPVVASPLHWFWNRVCAL